MNKVQLIGRLGGDPELNYVNGCAITKFSVVTGDDWIDKKTKEKMDTTEWHKIVCFRKLAEIAGEYLKKGSKIYVEGKLKTEKWQEDNKKDRYFTEVVVSEFIMLDSKGKEAELTDMNSKD